MTDAHEARGKHVKQEAAQEFLHCQGHQALLVAVRRVSPAKGDLVALEGLKFPQSVLCATQVYRKESDQVARFKEEFCEPHPKDRERARVLYQSYRKWAEDVGETPLSERMVGSRVT